MSTLEITLNLEQLETLAALVAERLTTPAEDGWLDTRAAAAYLGIHEVTLRRLAAERRIPVEQERAGCKLYFRRSDLDAQRRGDAR